MRALKNSCIFIILGLVLVPASSAQRKSWPAKCHDGDVCVLYTSKLLGYIRTDDNKHTKCGDPNGPPKDSVTTCFERTMWAAQHRNPSALVVAMGDNLAPEYESRFELDDKGNRKPKPRTGFESLSDNVLEELKKFYDVIVPGKEDFYFGTQRLSVLASSTKQLNAANMAETPSYPAAPSEPNLPKPRGYVESDPHVSPFDDGHLVLIRDNGKPVYSIEIDQKELCIFKSEGNDKSSCEPTPTVEELSKSRVHPEVTPKLGICPADDLSPCKGRIPGRLMGPGSRPETRVVSYDLSGEFYPSGSRVLMCLELKSSKRYCHAMVVDERLFQDFPYSIVKKKAGNYVVFPVAGSDVKQLVSKINRVWDPSYLVKGPSEVAIWDPVSAVRQAYYECRHNRQCDTNTHIVVLAQMTRVAALQLAAKISDVKAELIISKAELAASPFGNYMDYASAGQTVPVIATHSIFTDNDTCVPAPDSLGQTVRNPVHLVAISGDKIADKRVSHVKTPAGADWCVDRGVIPTYSYAEQHPKATEEQNKKENQAQGIPVCTEFTLDKQANGKGSPDLEHFMAEQLRATYRGDAGVVSTHEVFRGREICDPMGLPEQTQRAIWEGALITTVRISGKNLRAALDAQSTAPSDRQLVMSGIVSNDNKDYYINGKPLLDGSYYTVIAPDALVLGDPNYTTLSDPTFQTPDVHNDTVAGLICEVLGRTRDTKPNCNRDPQTQPVPNNLDAWLPPHFFALHSYVQSVVAPRPHDPLPELTQDEACEDTSKGKKKGDKKRGKESNNEKTEEKKQPPCAQKTDKRVELRPLWFAKLQKNTLSYALSKANNTDVAIGTKFAGVTDSRVVQAHSENYSVDHNLRLGRAWDHASAGVEETIQFSRSRQGNTSAPGDSVTLNTNAGTIGPFFELALARNAAPNWRLILRPADFSDNFARTVNTLTGASDTSGASSSFKENLPAQRSLSMKAGFRFEAPQRQDSLFSSDGNSFIEGGYKSTYNINLPAELTLNPGLATQTMCSLAVKTFNQCAGSVIAVDATGKTITNGQVLVSRFQSERQNGVYWTGLFAFPIGKRFTYKISGDGDVRFGDGLSSETLYAISVDNYLQTRIWGNFSVAPHMGWFFYENQVEHNTLTRRTYDVSLTYTFDWHRGMGWRAFFTKPETAK